MNVQGILPVIPTPFRDGRFDPASFERLIEHMLDSVDGYVVLGSTGEAPSLTTEERCAIADFALAKTPPDKTVVVHEGRGAEDKGSINQEGYYQAAGFMGLEVHVKDEARFPGKWAFFVFGDERHQFVGMHYCPFCGRVLSRELWNLEKKK